MAPTFPVDVFYEIVAFIHNKGVKPLYSKEEAKKTHIQLSQVSRCLASASRGIQYEHVHFSTLDRFVELLDILETPNNITAHIREISFGAVTENSFPVTLPLWTLKVLDIPTFEFLFPRLKHVRFNSIPRSTAHQGRKNTALTGHLQASVRRLNPPSDCRLTAFAFRANLFHSPKDATTFMSNMPHLYQLCILDSSPTFFLAILPLLPSSIKALRIEEYQLWHYMPPTEVSLTQRFEPPARTIALEHLYYRELSGLAAYLLEEVLVELSKGICVKISFADRRLHRHFDIEQFRSRITKAARRAIVLGVERYLAYIPGERQLTGRRNVHPSVDMEGSS